MQSAQVVTLKSGQQNASSVDSKSPMHSLVGAFGSSKEKMRSSNYAAVEPTCEALDINSSERRMGRRGVMRTRCKRKKSASIG